MARKTAERKVVHDGSWSSILDGVMSNQTDVEWLSDDHLLYALGLSAYLLNDLGHKDWKIEQFPSGPCLAGIVSEPAWQTNWRPYIGLSKETIRYYVEKGWSEYASIDEIWTYYKPERCRWGKTLEWVKRPKQPRRQEWVWHPVDEKLQNQEAVWALVLHEIAHVQQHQVFRQRWNHIPPEAAHKGIFSIELYKLIEKYPFEAVQPVDIMPGYF